VPVLVWQGVQECQNIDYNRANPAPSTDLMSGLVLPPNLKDWLISGTWRPATWSKRANTDIATNTRSRGQHTAKTTGVKRSASKYLTTCFRLPPK
jgi:hypothetical protein